MSVDVRAIVRRANSQRRRIQTGNIFRKGGAWFGRWREDRLVDGEIKRVQVCRKLADYCDRYRSESDVKPLLAEKVASLNEGRANAQSTQTLTSFVDLQYLPSLKTENGYAHSTIDCYKKLWRTVKPYVGSIALRDFRTVDAATMLKALGQAGHSRNSLHHAKAFLSGVFKAAKSAGAFDGLNPVADAVIPRNARPPQNVHAASDTEALAMLDALQGNPKARAAVGLVFFAGLRPGEVRGLKWEDYGQGALYNPSTRRRKDTLTIHRAVWRTHEKEPKTAAGVRVIPVIEPLRVILAQLRKAEGSPSNGWILRGSRRDVPLNLANLARRNILPALEICTICRKRKHTTNGHAFKRDESIPKWHGWYAFRRGAGTIVTAESDALAAKGVLGHANVATTQAHYVKDDLESVQRGLSAVEKRVLRKISQRSAPVCNVRDTPVN